jgi:hypothetical protein
MNQCKLDVKICSKLLLQLLLKFWKSLPNNKSLNPKNPATKFSGEFVLVHPQAIAAQRILITQQHSG